MLPDCRKEGDIFSIPKFTIERKDVGSFMEELEVFMENLGIVFSAKRLRRTSFDTWLASSVSWEGNQSSP